MDREERLRRHYDIQEVRSVARVERLRGRDALRRAVDGARADLGLPARDWWYDDLGLRQVAERLAHRDEIMSALGMSPVA